MAFVFQVCQVHKAYNSLPLRLFRTPCVCIFIHYTYFRTRNRTDIYTCSRSLYATNAIRDFFNNCTQLGCSQRDGIHTITRWVSLKFWHFAIVCMFHATHEKRKTRPYPANAKKKWHFWLKKYLSVFSICIVRYAIDVMQLLKTEIQSEYRSSLTRTSWHLDIPILLQKALKSTFNKIYIIDNKKVLKVFRLVRVRTDLLKI